MGNRKLVLYYDAIFLEHDTGWWHPECPGRLIQTEAHFKKNGLWDSFEIRSPRAATVEELQLVHGEAHVARVRSVCEQGGGMLDADTCASARSYEAACRAAGATLDCVDGVLREPRESAFALIRPPGHHAGPDYAMGFCLFNNVAIAARYAQKKHGVVRVAIVDWDVHHGNGTQEIFYSDPTVLYISLHRYPFYPGTGQASETGAGPGEGCTVNVPLPGSTTREKYLEIFREVVPKRLAEFRPDLTLVSAGFDAYEDDPVGDGGFGLIPEDYGLLTRVLREAAGERLLSVLEGGYSLAGLPLCIEQHLQFLHNA